MRTLCITIILLILVSTVCIAAGVSGPQAISITVYNDNFALVKDSRTVQLVKGVNVIDVEDVSAQIDATSVLFKCLSAPNGVTVLEQNYQYDLIAPDNILKKLVGERVWLEDGKSGILLNPPSNGGLVVKMDDGKLVMNAPVKQVDKMPEGLRPKPTLNWMLQSDVSGEQKTEITYITNGVSWKADYVALVNADDSALDLSGWVTLTNSSGATYKDAQLTLMAGDVRRVQPQNTYDTYRKGEMAMSAPAPQFQEKTFFEYHIYTMARPTTIAQNETKQVSLLGASNVNVTKKFIYDGRKEWWGSWYTPGRGDDPGRGYDTSTYHKVSLTLELKNSKDNHMGMPLPKGKIRVYKLDSDGSQQFIGEDMIDHTPRDESLKLYIGDAFDVVGDHKRTNVTRIADGVYEETFEIKIRNHKESDVQVSVVEHVWGDWTITAKSTDFNKIDASTIEFPVKVAKDGETVVTYTMRTKW